MDFFSSKFLKNHQFLPQEGGEMTPFFFKGKEYRLENVMYSGIANREVKYNYQEDFMRIRNMETGFVISHPLVNHYFGTMFVWQDKAYIFAADYEFSDKWWSCKKISVIYSEDLISWSAPATVLEAQGTESLFNTSVVFCDTPENPRFIMLYESNDPTYHPFTFKFAESKDLIHWNYIPGALYGTDKYVGGPTLHWLDNMFYLTYVNEFPEAAPNGHSCSYDTRITRSKDLFHWQDAPMDRPVLRPDFTHEIDPVNHPGIFERNASDAEFLEKNGKVYVYWNGGNQWGVSDSQTAEFDGSLKEFFKLFFPEEY